MPVILTKKSRTNLDKITSMRRIQFIISLQMNVLLFDPWPLTFADIWISDWLALFVNLKTLTLVYFT